MPQTVTVEITAEGKVSIGTAGFAGSSCKQATAALESALGVVTKDTPTAEATQAARQQNQLKAGQR